MHSNTSSIDDLVNWTSQICPDGLLPFRPDSRLLNPCFKQLCALLPIYTLLALVSAFRLGRLSTADTEIRRPFVHRMLLYARMVIVWLLIVQAPAQYAWTLWTHDNVSDLVAWPIELLVGGAQTIAFFIHFGYLHRLLSRRGSHRGSYSILFLLFMLAVVRVYEVTVTNISDTWLFLIFQIVLLAIYAITLVPSVSSSDIDGESLQHDETDLSNRPLGHAQDTGNWLSNLTFSWVNPLIDKAYNGHLNHVDDLFQLPKCLNIDQLTRNMQEAIGKTPKLLWALHRTHRTEFYAVGLLRIINDLSLFGGPLLLSALLSHTLDNDSDAFDALPYWYALGLFSTSVLAAITATHFGYRIAILKTKALVGLTTTIYRKSLEARSLDETKPEVLNLMSTDAANVTEAFVCLHIIWSIPMQIIGSLYLLYFQVGLSFLAGVAFMAVLFPINQYMAGKLNHYSAKMMEQKDERVALCSEVMGNVKSIKLQSWENIFIEKIQGIRLKEMKCLKTANFFHVIVMFTWQISKVLLSLLTFGVFVLTGNQMTASTTFTTVALMNMLMSPLNSVPWILSDLSDAWVSLKRIQELIDIPSINLEDYYSKVFEKANQNENGDNCVIFSIQNATFTFDKKRSLEDADEESTHEIVDFKLTDVNMTVHQGELVCLKGPLGGGKSSLLSALIAKLQRDEGTIYLNDLDQGFGYVAQTTWLQRGTIRENIVWGADFEANRYQTVVEACALTEDISILGGDQKDIGESGQMLSGGQRARVALARAVYQDKEIYLLDDVLSALDAHVATHIVNHCLLGLLREKTRIVITEHHRVLYNADQVFCVENGLVTLIDRATLPQYDKEESHEISSSTKTTEANDVNSVLNQEYNEKDNLNEESKEYGTLSWNVFRTYANATGIWLSLFWILQVVLQKITENLGDIWLAHWVEPNNSTNNVVYTNDTVPSNDIFNLEIYASLAGVNSLVTMVRAIVCVIAGLKAAIVIHDRLLKRVLEAQFQFFDITPLGRLLNRFSSDVRKIDSHLPFRINYFFSKVSSLIAVILVCLYALPWLAVIILPLAPIYLYIQNQYRYSSRDIQRLSSNALSPLYAQFTETLQGLTTIRAMTASERFQKIFRVKLTESIRAQLSAFAAENWLTIRLQFIGSLVVGGCALIAAITSGHVTNTGMVGLAISYALSITELLETVLYAVAQVEANLIAVERTNEYSELEPEIHAEGNPSVGVSSDWPNAGAVQYVDASLTYRANLKPSLKSIQLELTQGQRVGVAGRTGAGKSSLVSALFRVVPLSSGRIMVDSVNIADVPIEILRKRLALVPQQPFLFSGTIRDNLDPQGVHSDSRIWQAIDDCLAKPLVQSMGGLTAKLEPSGSNLSAGQKQLVCLARALLKHSKIVCIDEGTANLDSESEQNIQLVLRNAFKDATVLLIAHRITSLQNTDRVIVMHDGQLVEDGATTELAANPTSLFHKMLQKQVPTNENDETSNNETSLIKL